MQHLLVLVLLVLLGSNDRRVASAQEVAADFGSQQLDTGQLDQLVAPIALYPDPLLAQVLMASTYPLEVVQDDRLAKENKKLKDEKLKEALEKKNRDASVKDLCRRRRCWRRWVTSSTGP